MLSVGIKANLLLFVNEEVRHCQRPASGCSASHKAGICCIRPSPMQHFIMHTGCYDEKVRSWDLRNLRDPLDQVFSMARIFGHHKFSLLYMTYLSICF